MTELSPESLASYQNATTLSVKGEPIPLARKSHLAFGLFLNFFLDDSGHFNKDVASSLSREQKITITYSIAQFDGLLSKESKIRPTVEQAQAALSCAYNLYSEPNLEGQKMREVIRNVANRLGLEVVDDKAIFQQKETFDVLKSLQARFERQL